MQFPNKERCFILFWTLCSLLYNSFVDDGICTSVEIDYTGDKKNDLDDDTVRYLGAYQYVGVIEGNDSPIYRLKYDYKVGRHTKRHESYLVKDWDKDQYWKVLVKII